MEAVKESELQQYVEEVAGEVYADAKKEAGADRYTIDPLTIITIASILMQLFQFIIDWYKERNQAVKALGSLGFIKKWFIWRGVRKEIKNKQEAGYIYNSVVNKMYAMSYEDRVKLFNLKR